jgi:peptidoglycan/LPS O-acetylase OafA/YrhL
MPTLTESQSRSTPEQRLDVRATASSPKPQRIPALDFTKGALVLIMVLYHWINYFIGPQWKYYPYLRFLTPSFIFITGFMVSNIYLSKYGAADPRLPKRLFVRGIKLLAIFIVLNVARAMVIPLLHTDALVQNPLTLTNIVTVFASGNLPVTGDKLASFSILVPISYLLMFSGLLMLPYRVYRYTFHLVCAILLLSILIFGLAGLHSFNLEFITIGLLGVLAGFTPMTAINNIVRNPYALAFAYGCYVIAVTIWNVPFPILIVGVSLSLMILYLIGTSISETGTIGSEFILLGKYSLLGYISQVAILQILSAGSRRISLGPAVLVISFVAAFVLTTASVEVVDRARAKTPSIDRLYKAVFA